MSKLYFFFLCIFPALLWSFPRKSPVYTKLSTIPQKKSFLTYLNTFGHAVPSSGSFPSFLYLSGKFQASLWNSAPQPLPHLALLNVSSSEPSVTFELFSPYTLSINRIGVSVGVGEIEHMWPVYSAFSPCSYCWIPRCIPVSGMKLEKGKPCCVVNFFKSKSAHI